MSTDTDTTPETQVKKAARKLGASHESLATGAKLVFQLVASEHIVPGSKPKNILTSAAAQLADLGYTILLQKLAPKIMTTYQAASPTASASKTMTIGKDVVLHALRRIYNEGVPIALPGPDPVDYNDTARVRPVLDFMSSPLAQYIENADAIQREFTRRTLELKDSAPGAETAACTNSHKAGLVVSYAKVKQLASEIFKTCTVQKTAVYSMTAMLQWIYVRLCKRMIDATSLIKKHRVDTAAVRKAMDDLSHSDHLLRSLFSDIVLPPVDADKFKPRTAAAAKDVSDETAAVDDGIDTGVAYALPTAQLPKLKSTSIDSPVAPIASKKRSNTAAGLEPAEQKASESVPKKKRAESPVATELNGAAPVSVATPPTRHLKANTKAVIF